MRILVISAKNKTVFNFRGDLIKDMVAHGNEVYVTGPNQDYVDDIMQLGVSRFFEVPSVKDNTSVKNDLHYLKLLKKVIKEINPDIVFSYNIKPVIYGSIAAKWNGVEHIFAMITGLGRVFAGNSIKAKILRVITKFLYKKAFDACEKVIFQNDDDRRELLDGRYLIGNKTAVVNGSGVNMERFRKAEYPDSPVFLMVGRIIREKGILEYCEAARKVKKIRPEARFLLLGGVDSSLGALQKEDIQGYLDDGSIEWLGEVKDPVSYYGMTSVFVLPSYYREGLPRTILEAMACGRPVITTDWVGCREAIQNGKNGYLVPIKDSDALSEKMVELCDMEKAKSMGEKAFEICKDKYEVSIINTQMRTIMQY